MNHKKSFLLFCPNCLASKVSCDQQLLSTEMICRSCGHERVYVGLDLELPLPPKPRDGLMGPDNASVKLMFRILDVVKESGVDRTDALSATRAAEAMLPQLGLDVKPLMAFKS
jgi:hypothetical protein